MTGTVTPPSQYGNQLSANRRWSVRVPATLFLFLCHTEQQTLGESRNLSSEGADAIESIWELLFLLSWVPQEAHCPCLLCLWVLRSPAGRTRGQCPLHRDSPSLRRPQLEGHLLGEPCSLSPVCWTSGQPCLSAPLPAHRALEGLPKCPSSSGPRED